MSDTLENTELRKFYQSFLADIKSEQIGAEEGGILEQIFTQHAVDLLQKQEKQKMQELRMMKNH